MENLRSYIKIYGPPVYDAIKALEKMAVDFEDVCIMDSLLATYFSNYEPSLGTQGLSVSAEAVEYFSSLDLDITPERCAKLVSKFGQHLGEYDFFFEWYREPTIDEYNSLIQKIDETLKPLGVRYTITSKK